MPNTVTLYWTATHRATCVRCNATSIIAPDTFNPRTLQARSCVARRSAETDNLPVLTDPTVWWDCLACDKANKPGLAF
jgi:hypothetical protein